MSDNKKKFEDILSDALKDIDPHEVFRKLYDHSAFATVQDRGGFSFRQQSLKDWNHVDRKTQMENAREQFDYLVHHFFETGDETKFSGYELFYIFMFSSVAGSMLEELWCRASNGIWENRTSVIYGHLSFAEGIGGAFLTALLYRDMDAPISEIFAKSFVWGSALEYIMSWGEETFTGYRSWDYSHRLFNINGRICFMYSCFWGALGVIWCELIYPIFKAVIEKIPKSVGVPMFWALSAFLLYDIIISVMAKTRFTLRQDGKEACNRLEKALDKRFPDDVVINAYPNSIRSKHGEIQDDTLNSTTAKAMGNDSIKSKLKEVDNIREEGGNLREVNDALRTATGEFREYAGNTARDMTNELREMATDGIRERTEDLKSKTEDLKAMTEDIKSKTEAAVNEASGAMNREAPRRERFEALRRAGAILISIIHPGGEPH